MSEPIPMTDLLAEIRRVTGSDAEFVPVAETFLIEQRVEPWDGLPLWLAASINPDFAGMMAIDVSRAQAAGLRHRSLAETIRDVLIWEEEAVTKDYGASGAASGLSLERERELLAVWANLNS